jgi:hypothetical protein
MGLDEIQDFGKALPMALVADLDGGGALEATP